MESKNIKTNIEIVPQASILDRQWNNTEYANYCPINISIDEFYSYIDFFRDICRIPICSKIRHNILLLNEIKIDIIYYRLYLQTNKDIIVKYFIKKYL